MKFNTMPKEVVPEMLAFIAEKGDFSEVCKELDGAFAESDIRALLREIANNLQGELKLEKVEPYSVSKCSYLSKDAKKIISFLSPREERTLLKAFGLVEDEKK